MHDSSLTDLLHGECVLAETTRPRCNCKRKHEHAHTRVSDNRDPSGMHPATLETLESSSSAPDPSALD